MLLLLDKIDEKFRSFFSRCFRASLSSFSVPLLRDFSVPRVPPVLWKWVFLRNIIGLIVCNLHGGSVLQEKDVESRDACPCRSPPHRVVLHYLFLCGTFVSSAGLLIPMPACPSISLRSTALSAPSSKKLSSGSSSGNGTWEEGSLIYPVAGIKIMYGWCAAWCILFLALCAEAARRDSLLAAG